MKKPFVKEILFYRRHIISLQRKKKKTLNLYNKEYFSRTTVLHKYIIPRISISFHLYLLY